MNLLDILQSQMGDQVIEHLSKEIRADKDTTKSAVDGALATMVSALAKNVSNPQRANSLMGALDRDHDGSILNDLAGLMMQGGRSQQQRRSTNGLGILEHMLGGNTNNVVQMMSKGSGLDFLKSGKLLTMLAPIVMGVLGKTKKQQGLDLGGLASILSGTVQQASRQRNDMGIIGKILDADGDGNIGDEIAGMGMKVLGNLFRK
ncbi:MAG: DUF937 domain-containing protein [Saprospiraceae bacterium]|nr:DUF937 domain-containing protein [Saprospiraceae bacterium]